MGKENLEPLLGSQNCVYGKVGLGYKSESKNKTKQHIFFKIR